MKITSNKHNHRHPIFAADEDADRFDDVDFEDYENVKITIEDDSCTIEMSAISDGMTFGVKIVISKNSLI